MKRLFISVAAVMLFACCLVFTANAEGYEMNVAVEVADTVAVGDEIPVSVNFSGNTGGFSTIAVTLTYPEGFTYMDSAAVSDLIGESFSYQDGATYVFEHDADKRTLTFIGGSVDNVTAAEGELFTAIFKVGNYVELYNTEYTFTVAEADTAYSADGNTVTLTAEADTITYIDVAGTVETKVTYGAGKYYADIYFSGKDANAVAFGYKYGANLTFEGFTPADGLETPKDSLVINENGYYATIVAAKDTANGVIKGANSSAYLGRITFAVTGEFSKEDDAYNIIITDPVAAVEDICTAEYFLFVPNRGTSLTVDRLPVTFAPINYGSSIKVVVNFTAKAEDGVTDSDLGVIKVNGEEVAREVEGSTSDKLSYTIENPTGTLSVEVEKQGYIPCTYGFTPEEATSYTIEINMIPGDIRNPASTTPEALEADGYGIVDIVDFVRVTRGFSTANAALKAAVNIDENSDGAITVSDLNFVKNNYGATKDTYSEENETVVVTEGITEDAE